MGRNGPALKIELSLILDIGVRRKGERLDNTKFHLMGAVFFTAQCGLLQLMKVVKTRMQVAGSELCHGGTVCRQMFTSDGITGFFGGFGTSAVALLPGRVLALTSLEVSKDMML